MKLYQNYSLKNFNTFGLDARADHFVVLEDESSLKQASDYLQQPHKLLLGGGSNLLFVEDIVCPVIHINLSGVEYFNETPEAIDVKVMAGESWHKFVMETIAFGYSGLENLALIPGQVGAAPVQNIGAYGVELKDRLLSVEAIKLSSMEMHNFDNFACQFAYRDSYFKRNLNDYLITSATFRLDKIFRPVLTYQPIAELFESRQPKDYDARDVAQAVISIRQSKLPDPKSLGNAGSFFKNPVVTHQHFKRLQQEFPNIVGYQQADSMKLAAGWLIDNLGFKGKRFKDAAVHDKQALVLVNCGNASGRDILTLASQIEAAVAETYGVTLEKEVRVVGAETKAS
ncbi:MAG: UDP-N-acetylmuramate dehydrogenase [Kangiellaceae bacterium]|nr:UDP-N-acetylmuramate dehydrogenase [Kangiellaceae bacterium]